MHKTISQEAGELQQSRNTAELTMVLSEEVAALVQSLDAKAVELLQIEQESIVAQRASERHAELLAMPDGECAALEQTNVRLENEVSEVQLELDILCKEKIEVQRKLEEFVADLEIVVENSRLWQMMAEKNLHDLPIEEQARMGSYVVEVLRQQLEQAQQEAEYFKNQNDLVKEDAQDL